MIIGSEMNRDVLPQLSDTDAAAELDFQLLFIVCPTLDRFAFLLLVKDEIKLLDTYIFLKNRICINIKIALCVS